MRDLVLFVQFKKCEKHLWRNVTFSNLKAYITHGNIIKEGMLTLSVVTIFWSLVELIGVIKVVLSPSKKIVICFTQIPLKKMTKNALYFFLKTLFVLMIFKFWPSLFGHAEKTVWLVQNSWLHNLVNKQLQYIYCPISTRESVFRFTRSGVS